MLNQAFFLELQEYVERHLHLYIADSLEEEICFLQDILHNELENFVKANRKPSFAQVLFRFIDLKGYTDASLYKKAGIDRRHFSKIRSNPSYRVNKSTAVALAFALELTKKETDKLLSSAGFSLSDNDIFDLVIQFCLEKKTYNINEVNVALDYFSLKPLGNALE
ncbi:hypothetical protein DS745_01635 [Anaerobacillus alkaliphilus]|uniref:Uncharacterized protein n=1 Tax=Anaerobacillus alkaliphilus TaxID=1548597 RepID=A0A4Q0VWM0_9BACI|nr:helix-turn-helix transcriptional regulator [Anaerobacillus alkaliphilus]RXJ04113.1 hypothetical protein DS745_01635 [Anaerobacillus alkaliphilus]